LVSFRSFVPFVSVRSSRLVRTVWLPSFVRLLVRFVSFYCSFRFFSFSFVSLYLRFVRSSRLLSFRVILFARFFRSLRYVLVLFVSFVRYVSFLSFLLSFRSILYGSFIRPLWFVHLFVSFRFVSKETKGNGGSEGGRDFAMDQIA
jgi:hypothetical protein